MLLLAALTAQAALANSVFCPSPDLHVQTVSAARAADGTVTLKVTVRNEGTTCADSTVVEVFYAKSAYFLSGGSLEAQSVGLPLIAPGASRIVSFTIARDFYDTSKDVSFYGFVDSIGLDTEFDERDNAFVVGVKRGNGNQTSTWTTAFRTPAVVLAEIDGGFVATDAAPKYWLKAEIAP